VLTTDPPAPPVPGPDDVQPVGREWLDRLLTGLVTAIPLVGLVYVLVTWHPQWHDLTVFVAAYLLTGLGVTVGFHRLLTHRAFKTGRIVKAVLTILGSAAIEGPVTAWVADHRKHHHFSDQVGDPHSPHAEQGHGFRGALQGLFHAHVGWLFIHTHRGAKDRYARDLRNDPMMVWLDRLFPVWAIGGLAACFVAGWLLGGTIAAGWSGLLWGGAIRMVVVHHVTYSINSVCHFFGRREYRTSDESRNVWWLAPFTFGEAWHNSHHAFPTSARHGLGRRQLDVSAWVIGGLEKVGLAWDVIRVSPERMAAKALA
jgi:stearoyl-CoA desaturase (delta-9 desaturase)